MRECSCSVVSQSTIGAYNTCCCFLKLTYLLHATAEAEDIDSVEQPTKQVLPSGFAANHCTDFDAGFRR